MFTGGVSDLNFAQNDPVSILAMQNSGVCIPVVQNNRVSIPKIAPNSPINR